MKKNAGDRSSSLNRALRACDLALARSGVERDRLEHALRAHTRELRHILDSVKDYAIIILDVDGRVTNWNEGARRIKGYRPKEIMGEHISRFYTIDDIRRKKPQLLLRKAARIGRAEDTGWRLRKDGSLFWANVTITALRDETRKLIGYVKTTRDLSKVKKLEDERQTHIAELEQRIEERTRNLQFLSEMSRLPAPSVGYEKLLEALAGLIVPRVADWCAIDIFTEAGTLKRVVTLHRDPKKVRLVTNARKKYPEDTRAIRGRYHVARTGKSELYAKITDELIAKEVSDQSMREFIRRLGLVSIMLAPVRSRDRVLGVISFANAESGRHFGNEDLALAKEIGQRAGIAVSNAMLFQKVQEDDRNKDQFLVILAHELRNPLTPLLHSLEYLKVRGLGANDLTQSLDVALRQGHKISVLLKSLLDVARARQGKIDLEFAPVEATKVIAGAIETARPLIEAGKHELHLELPRGPFEIVVDQLRVEQILVNLISNAAKYTPHRGKITIRLEREHDLAVFRVKDNGTGIAPEMLSKIFDLFVQSDQSLSSMQGGLGIGLRLGRTLAELHGGSLIAESAGANKGSEFTLRLPIHPSKRKN